MKNAVVDEDSFEVKKNARSICYRFIYKTPKVGDLLLEQVEIIPYSLSIEVKDSIAGGAYGE